MPVFKAALARFSSAGKALFEHVAWSWEPAQEKAIAFIARRLGKRPGPFVHNMDAQRLAENLIDHASRGVYPRSDPEAFALWRKHPSTLLAKTLFESGAASLRGPFAKGEGKEILRLLEGSSHCPEQINSPLARMELLRWGFDPFEASWGENYPSPIFDDAIHSFNAKAFREMLSFHTPDSPAFERMRKDAQEGTAIWDVICDRDMRRRSHLRSPQAFRARLSMARALCDRKIFPTPESSGAMASLAAQTIDQHPDCAPLLALILKHGAQADEAAFQSAFAWRNPAALLALERAAPMPSSAKDIAVFEHLLTHPDTSSFYELGEFIDDDASAFQTLSRRLAEKKILPAETLLAQSALNLIAQGRLSLDGKTLRGIHELTDAGFTGKKPARRV